MRTGARGRRARGGCDAAPAGGGHCPTGAPKRKARRRLAVALAWRFLCFVKSGRVRLCRVRACR
ncbi:hypothetical protein EMIT0158MI4_160074 [Burkholderia ambifaria]